MKETKSKIKRFMGDGLHVEMSFNERVLEITGDGCIVMLTKNTGSVRIVGDGCYLKVKNNTGDIEYKGDGGRVVLGSNSCSNKIKYIGHGGRINFDYNNDDDNNNNNNNNNNNPRERTAKERKNSLSVSLPELDNILNERKEADRAYRNRQRKLGKGLQRNKTMVVTKIITVRSNGGSVKR